MRKNGAGKENDLSFQIISGEFSLWKLARFHTLNKLKLIWGEFCNEDFSLFNRLTKANIQSAYFNSMPWDEYFGTFS